MWSDLDQTYRTQYLTTSRPAFRMFIDYSAMSNIPTASLVLIVTSLRSRFRYEREESTPGLCSQCSTAELM